MNLGGVEVTTPHICNSYKESGVSHWMRVRVGKRSRFPLRASAKEIITDEQARGRDMGITRTRIETPLGSEQTEEMQQPLICPLNISSFGCISFSSASLSVFVYYN